MAQFGTPYRKWQPKGDFDAIVIGSGIGGLGVAALLGKRAGKRVLVLERHATKAGGFTHIFKRKDYDWDVGLHYIGEVHRPESGIRKLFDEITGGRLEWQPMGEVYDTVVVGEERFEYVAGRENWRQRMHEYFPTEGEAIDRYLDLVKETTRGARSYFGSKALPGAAAAFAGPFMRRGTGSSTAASFCSSSMSNCRTCSSLSPAIIDSTLATGGDSLAAWLSDRQ